MPLLTISDLTVRYGHILGTQGVSFSVEPGEILALIGNNGSGKSSTFKAILGMAPYSEGSIRFDDTGLAGMSASQIVRLGIGYSPEGRRVFPQLTVAENLKMGGFIRSASECAERQEQIYGYFPRLRERAAQRASSMSGGEQQMLAIGRALMSRPKLFLLDEPSLGLAPIIVERIGDILEEIRVKENLTVILAEQNAHWAMHLASRAVILELGKVTLAGPSEELMHDKRVRDAYLGV